ncbi:MAG: hypothetical protein IJ412_06235 [Oscillospiraceae bacterium]|nr:hypothetical protein [Oscillospiraceae bacterium]
MTSYERVKNAMHYRPVDKVPVQYYYCPVGYYEHGDKLNDLYAALPGDFDHFRRVTPRGPSPEEIDAAGNYHAIRADDWGVPWEYRIFGITGIPQRHILTCPEDVENFKTPPHVLCEGPEFESYKAYVASLKAAGLYAQGNCGNLYERIISLYGDENALCDIAMDEPGINALADAIVEYDAAALRRAIAAGCDGVSFGDDYGTQNTMLMSPDMWRRFFKPRLKRLFAPAVAAGLDIHFHSCGMVRPILEDLAEIGVTSVWPQLPAYDMQDLAGLCRSLGLAVAIHTDRAVTMTSGTPQQVRDLVLREYDTFKMQDGGSWFYIEADNGFPFENLEALVNTVRELRGE